MVEEQKLSLLRLTSGRLDADGAGVSGVGSVSYYCNGGV